MRSKIIFFYFVFLCVLKERYFEEILTLFDRLEKRCYGKKTRKVGVCTYFNICRLGIYQPFIYSDQFIELKGYDCESNQVCCVKGCLSDGYFVGICISRDHCEREEFKNFKTISHRIVFGEKCYFDEICCT